VIKAVCPKCGSSRIFNDENEYEKCLNCGDEKRKQLNLKYVLVYDEEFGEI